MRPLKRCRFAAACALLAALVVAGLLRADESATPSAPVDRASPAIRKGAPETVADLVAIETRVKGLVEKLRASTVAVRIGNAQGTGVIVSKDGYVLTAAHVAGAPKRNVRITLSDGREVAGETLGLDRFVDAGMIRITDKGEWPAVEMAPDDSYSVGDWCLAVGHPNGYHKDRGSVVRMGRVLAAVRRVIQTDCTLVGGDSGGPLFDLEGRVIGIHSRIGVSTAWNFHVPVGVYRREWDQLVKGEEVGGGPEPGAAILGVNGEDVENGCRITKVPAGFPAEAAGVREGDVVTRFDGAKVQSFKALQQLVWRRNPGDEVPIEILRGGKTLQLKATLGRRE